MSRDKKRRRGIRIWDWTLMEKHNSIRSHLAHLFLILLVLFPTWPTKCHILGVYNTYCVHDTCWVSILRLTVLYVHHRFNVTLSQAPSALVFFYSVGNKKETNTSLQSTSSFHSFWSTPPSRPIPRSIPSALCLRVRGTWCVFIFEFWRLFCS